MWLKEENCKGWPQGYQYGIVKAGEIKLNDHSRISTVLMMNDRKTYLISWKTAKF